MFQSRRTVIAGLSAALLLAGIAASPASAQQLKEVRIGFQKAGIFPVVKQRGTIENALKSRGITVKWVEFQFGPPILEAINTGNVDFGYTGDAPPIFAQAARANLLYVAAVPSEGYNQAIVVPDASPIKTLADLKGLKIRMIGNPLFIDTMNALGGNGVALGFDQVFSSMQTGVIDGAENNPPSFVAQNHNQVAKYFTMTEHLIIPELLVFSRISWNKLTPADQALVTKFAKEAQAEQRVLWYAAEKTALDKMKEVGTDVVTSIDKTPFRDAVKPVWDKYGAKYAEMTKRIAAVS